MWPDKPTCSIALRDESVRAHTFEKPIPHSKTPSWSTRTFLTVWTLSATRTKRSYKKHSHLTRRTDRALAKGITDTITVRNERIDWLEM